MSAECFLDTNVLLYAYDRDADQKRTLALGLLEAAWKDLGRTAISVQVLQEFYVNFMRRSDAPEEVSAIIEDLMLWPVVDNTVELFGHGMALRARYDVSIWDAMILAAAKASGAGKLYSEDLNHGQDYDGVCVVNPFRRA